VTDPGAPKPCARAGRLLAIALAVATSCGLFGACSSGGGAEPNAVSTSSTTETTRPPAEERVQAALVVTGDRTLTIAGTKGTCTIPEDGAASYVMLATDYPALGPAGDLKAFGPTSVPGSGTVPGDVTAVVGGTGFVSPMTGAGVTVSPDQRLITLNADLSGGAGSSPVGNVNGASSPFHIHIAGTLRCT
jgi:ABC-type Fe3+-hydroxamate transport system substrate-binding protein